MLLLYYTMRKKEIMNIVSSIYGSNEKEISDNILELIFNNKKSTFTKKKFSEKDCFVIVYPDHVQKRKEKSIKTLHNFFVKNINDLINHVHVLPFFPYSSDDGFSVINHYSVRKDLGSWSDINKFSKDYSLMFDAVINHVSAENFWFKRFLLGDLKYSKYFINFNHRPDTSKVFRVREHPLLTAFLVKDKDKKKNKRYVWTTFSKDQVDLDFSNPEVLLEVLKILAFYINKGARAIRLDAVAFLYKDIKDKSINHKKTYEILKLIKIFCQSIDSNVLIVSETNLSYEDNLSYILDKKGADLIYNFTLPPLIFHTFLKKNVRKMYNFLTNMIFSDNFTYLNFTASHDGVGLTPAKDFLNVNDIEHICLHVKSKGGKISYRKKKDKKIAYECNISFRDFFDSSDAFLASQSIMLALKGVPAIYFSSFFGAHNYYDGLKKFGYSRAINREKFSYNKLSSEIFDLKSEKGYIFSRYKRLLDVRRKEKCFSPHASQEVIYIKNNLFILKRSFGKELIYYIVNVSDKKVKLPKEDITRHMGKESLKDIISDRNFSINKDVVLIGYEYLWLKKEK